jgi:6-phosphogluconolactonase
MNSFRITGGHVEVWRDLQELCSRAAELLIGIAREAVTARDAFTVALSGGKTPKALYELLRDDTMAARLPWEKTHVFWSDERCVPPDDPESNYRLANQSLLAHVPVPREQIHRMHGEDLDPQHAAEDYAAELENHFGAGDPRFSLILLGMGEDGHTASLFPHSPVLADREHTVAAPYVEKLAAYRLTLTLRTLNAAATVMFLVSGEEKATALKAALEDVADDDGSVPARLVRPKRGELVWLVDEAAAKVVSSIY